MRTPCSRDDWMTTYTARANTEQAKKIVPLTSTRLWFTHSSKLEGIEGSNKTSTYRWEPSVQTERSYTNRPFSAPRSRRSDYPDHNAGICSNQRSHSTSAQILSKSLHCTLEAPGFLLHRARQKFQIQLHVVLHNFIPFKYRITPMFKYSKRGASITMLSLMLCETSLKPASKVVCSSNSVAIAEDSKKPRDKILTAILSARVIDWPESFNLCRNILERSSVRWF